MDDIVGIATNASAYNGKFLKYNHSIGKFEFDVVVAGYATTAGIATFATRSASSSTALGLSGNPNINVGVVSATSFFGSGTNLTGIVTSIVAGTGMTVTSSTGQVIISPILSGIATYATSAGIATYATSAGIATYATNAGISTIADYASTAGISTVAQNLIDSPNIVVSSVNSSGVITASSFSGSGSNLTSLDASNLSSGTVPSTRITASSGNFTVGENLYINGSLSVGGTSIVLNAAQLQVRDKDIIVGYTTDTNGDEISNDNTANHGGISIASTVGSPIINIPFQVGINSNPSTYKQIIWIKEGNYSGMGTDAWVTNYAVSIGNTSSVKIGSRLTVGAGFTVYDTYLDAQDIRVNNINATGIVTASKLIISNGGNFAGVVTATSFSGSGTKLTGIVTSIVAGTGMTVTSSTGQVTVSSIYPVLKSPSFTYTSGVLTSIIYSDGSTKTFTYSSGILTKIDLVVGTKTYRKVFNYTSGILTSITQTEF